jgi:hypothetical protein
MSRHIGAVASPPSLAPSMADAPSVDRLCGALGMAAGMDVSRLPFVGADGTAGAEAELQASVQGSRRTMDLPLAISGSDFLANIQRRAAVGDTAPRQLHALERFLDANADDVWDNSWVRFPRRLLGTAAAEVFRADLRADKSDGSDHQRGDATKFVAVEQGIEYARVPISYLLKLALADATAALPERPEAVRKMGRRLLGHFLSDNTSPETCSFNVTSLAPELGGARTLVREAARRFLLTQLVLAYANRRYELEATGQKASACHAPTPPVRQRELNELISDAFYRELFMNPCLSGWDCGEDKSSYMGLCHEVLSRSQLNGVKKLRDAGIIVNNLVVMPSTSNLSLANNGVHVSVGSKRLSHADIPDHPTLESERRQVIFDCAIGLPTFFVHQSTSNAFLKAVLSYTRDLRPSRRYPGYLRVRTDAYRSGLIQMLRAEAPDLIEAFAAHDLIENLMRRLDDPTARASHRLLAGILDEAVARDPMKVEARDFNLAAERYYPGSLRRSQLEESLRLLGEELSAEAARLWSVQ